MLGFRMVLGVLVMQGAWGCRPSVGPEAETVEPLSKAKQMQAHFRRTTRIRRALIAGRLDRVATWAGEMKKETATVGFPQGTEALVASMQTAAETLEVAANRHSAAFAFGTLGVKCGDCHQILSKDWKVPSGALPVLDESASARMRRHGWATARLWEGIFWPSHERWQAGADILREPMDFALTERVTDPRQGRQAIRRIRTLATKAKDTHDPLARGELFGALIETCASCHDARKDAI